MSAYNGPRPGWERARQLPPDLIREGACTADGVDPDWFAPEATPAQARRAQRICTECPVAVVCDEWATARDEWGVWAGRMRRNKFARDRIDPETRDTARRLFAEGKDHRQVAELLDISVQTAIGYQSAWRRDQRRPA